MSFRAKNALVTFLFITLCIVFLSITRFSGFILYGTIFFMMLVYYFLVYWMLNFEVYPQGFITILLTPVLLLGGYMTVYYYFLRDLTLYIPILSTIFFLGMMYYFILTQNILNTSYSQNIGLTQAALVINNFFSIITFFAANLAIFLIQDFSLIIKLVFTLPFFVLIYLAFVMINNIDRIQYWFGVFFYAVVIISIVLLYLVNFINPISGLIMVIILAVLYRGITVVSLYSSRRVISFLDLTQIFLESLLIGFFLYLSSL